MPKKNKSIIDTIKDAVNSIVKPGSSKERELYELADGTPVSEEITVFQDRGKHYIKTPVFRIESSLFVYGNNKPVTPGKEIHSSKKNPYVKTLAWKLGPSYIRIITCSSPLSKRYDEESPKTWLHNPTVLLPSPEAPNDFSSPESSNSAGSSFREGLISMGLFQPAVDKAELAEVNEAEQEKSALGY